MRFKYYRMVEISTFFFKLKNGNFLKERFTTIFVFVNFFKILGSLIGLDFYLKSWVPRFDASPLCFAARQEVKCVPLHLAPDNVLINTSEDYSANLYQHPPFYLQSLEIY